MTLQWTEELAVGYDLIDQQHRELIEKFNNFLEACNRRRGKENLTELFQFLDEYVILHFQEEEALMKLHHYPAMAQHLEQHREFTSRLSELRQELEKSGPTIHVLIRTNKALLYWLTTHIKQVDVKLGRFLSQAGNPTSP
jgi:hemerythrin